MEKTFICNFCEKEKPIMHINNKCNNYFECSGCAENGPVSSHVRGLSNIKNCWKCNFNHPCIYDEDNQLEGEYLCPLHVSVIPFKKATYVCDVVAETLPAWLCRAGESA